MKPGPSGARLCVFSTGSLLAVQQPIAKAEHHCIGPCMAWRWGERLETEREAYFAGLIYAGPYKARRKATADGWATTSPLSLPLSPNVSRETIVSPADLVGSGMAELLGLSGVGVGALVGVGTPVLVGGRGRVLSGSGCVRTLYGTSVWVLVVEEL
jgi:hypothetical protein